MSGRYLHGENGSAAANVEDDLVLEDVLVLNDGVHVRPGADLVFLRKGGKRSIQRPTWRRGGLQRLTSISSWMPVFQSRLSVCGILQARLEGHTVVVVAKIKESVRCRKPRAPLAVQDVPLEVVLLGVLHGLELRLSGVDLHVLRHICKALCV
jgi:hypothetical protein